MDTADLDKGGAAAGVAIVTGAAKRIGEAICKCLHRNGYRIVVHYRSDPAAANALVAELNQIRPDSAVCKQSDLSHAGSPEDLVAAAVDQWGQLDLLVNNASEFYPTPVGQISPEDFQRIFNSNVQAPLLLAQSALPHLKVAKGSVVNILDIYASVVHKEHPVYCASKAALSMLTRSLAVEFAPTVRVNGVAPGAILWPDGEAELPEAKKSSVLDNIPLGVMGRPTQIAEAVNYLAGCHAEFITGQTLAIDGGRTL